MPARSPFLAAALSQIIAGVIVLAAMRFASTSGWMLPWDMFPWITGSVALILSWRLRLPVWWLPVQFLFIPGLFLAQRLAVDSVVYLVAFLLCWLLLGYRVRERVPLYLSSHAVWACLAELLPREGTPAFLDLGSGTGGGLSVLARRRPDARIVGVEASPLLWLLCRLRLAPTAARVRLGDLWAQDLAEFDLVYAFLSPLPMRRLWEKARREMKRGGLLVSNSFIVPDVAPTRVLELDDRRRTRLYIWEMPG